MTKTMRVRLDSGALVTLTGTEQEISVGLKTLGVDSSKYYLSSTRGLIEISEMEDSHLKNAVLKMTKEWVASLYSLSPTKVAEKIMRGIEYENPTWKEMVLELSNRE